MSWSSGVFSRLHNWVNDKNAAIKILASRHDAEDDNLAAGINACLHKGGQNSPTANIDFGAFKVTNAGNATAAQDYVTAAQLQAPALSAVAGAGTANTYTGTLSPAITTYPTNLRIQATFPAANTGAATLDLNGLGAKTIKTMAGGSLWRNAIVTTGIYTLVYNGTDFILTNPSKGFSGCYLYDTVGAVIATGGTANMAFGAGTETYDTDGYHDTSTNTTRITVPAGISRVKLVAQVRLTPASATSADAYYQVSILPSTLPGYAEVIPANTSTRVVYARVTTPPILVTEGSGEYFIMGVSQVTGVNVTAENVVFTLEAILE